MKVYSFTLDIPESYTQARVTAWLYKCLTDKHKTLSYRRDIRT